MAAAGIRLSAALDLGAEGARLAERRRAAVQLAMPITKAGDLLCLFSELLKAFLLDAVFQGSTPFRFHLRRIPAKEA